MANFILSAFADEIDPNFEEQLKGLKKLDIPYVELRGVNGKSFTLLTDDEVLDVRDLLARYGIKVWSLGSPIGKIHTNDDFETHKHLLTRIMDIGDMLDVKRIRMSESCLTWLKHVVSFSAMKTKRIFTVRAQKA